MAEVRLDKVTKKYGDNVAVNELSLHCKDSEFFFILGPSGAGKTSTLKMIAGLTTVDGGEIRIGTGWSTIWSRVCATWPWPSRPMRCIRT